MNAPRTLGARWRAARIATRRSRALHQALIGASPALRDELLEISRH